MVEQSYEDWLRLKLETLGRHLQLVPAQARPVDLVSRACPFSTIDTAAQREVAAAAARTSIANEIERRWPGAPYVIRQGWPEEFGDFGLEPDMDALVVFGVVYEVEA